MTRFWYVMATAAFWFSFDLALAAYRRKTVDFTTSIAALVGFICAAVVLP